jgi:hypothetical protein
MPRDIPIIFSAPMVLALLAGRKTMTRRLAQVVRKTRNPAIGESRTYSAPSPWCDVKPGDRLWVRENIKGCPDAAGFDGLKYMADDLWSEIPGSPSPDAQERFMALFNYGGKRGAGVPSIHMPRWASRLMIIVTEVKLGQVQYTSHNDILAEGVHQWPGTNRNYQPRWHWLSHSADIDHVETYVSAGQAWQALWTLVNGQKCWEANPEVVAIGGRVINANIDASEARAA